MGNALDVIDAWTRRRLAFEAMDTTASRRLGLIKTQELQRAGFSDRQIAGLARVGVIDRRRRGVYATAGAPRTWEQALLAVLMSAGDESLASHASGSRLWNFRYCTDGIFELTVPRLHATNVDGAIVHRSKILTPADQAVRGVIPCTSYARTLCDMTTQLSWLQLGRVLDDGLRRKVMTLDELKACVLRLDSGPHRRLSIVQGLLEQRSRPGYDPGGSDTELRLFALLESAGLPQPVQQQRVRVYGRTYFLDYSWPDRRIYLEWYGLAWHVGASAVIYDSARVSALSSIGWKPLIFTDASTDREIIDLCRSVLQ